MKNLFKSITTFLFAAALAFASSCTKNNDDNNGGGNASLGNVTVTTLTPTDITSTGATCGAEVTAEAGAMLMEMGVCWSTTAYPTINDSYLSTKNCSTTFVCTLEDLTPETKYHVRAYALNGTSYVYGEDKVLPRLLMVEEVLMIMNGSILACRVEPCGPPAMWVQTPPKAMATILHGARLNQSLSTIGIPTSMPMAVITS